MRGPHLGDELSAAELAVLVGVDHLCRTLAGGSLAQHLDAKVGLHRDGHAMRQHPAAVSILHGH